MYFLSDYQPKYLQNFQHLSLEFSDILLTKIQNSRLNQIFKFKAFVDDKLTLSQTSHGIYVSAKQVF